MAAMNSSDSVCIQNQSKSHGTKKICTDLISVVSIKETHNTQSNQTFWPEFPIFFFVIEWRDKSDNDDCFITCDSPNSQRL